MSSSFAPLCQVGNGRCAQRGVIESCSTVKKKLVHATTTGYWETEANYVYYLDLRLADELVHFFKDASVTELGAGHGCYTEYLASRNVSIRAFDGSPGIGNRTRNLVQTADLSRNLSLGKSDWVLCFEVAEHVPQKYEETFVRNLDVHNKKGILISWSSLNPPHGVGHVNPRSEEWVVARFAQLGYVVDAKPTQSLRRSALFPWFRSNVLVLRRSAEIKNF